MVLGCKYHGWSYDTQGHLTKAPQFDELPGFKKEDNSLYQIWVKTDPNGFVFVNFDADWNVFDPPTQALNTFAKYSKATKASSYVAFWQIEGDFNWKQASEWIVFTRKRLGNAD
jgi:phenylpropionate dioxygenase-like ring-hydroxylating dioxygenase large terminal subunit